MEPKLNFAHVCDYAFNGDGGKLCIIGVFKDIILQDVNKPHHQMFFVTNISVTDIDSSYKQEIKLVRESSGEEIIRPIVFNFSFGKKNVEVPVDVGCITQMNNVIFPEHGKYLFEVYLNGDILTKVPVSVSPLKKDDISSLST